MKVQYFAIYDSAVEAFMQPFVAQTEAHAIRICRDTIDRGDTTMSKHIHDFSLFHIAEFNDGDGVITPIIPIHCVSTLIALNQKDMFDDVVNATTLGEIK